MSVKIISINDNSSLKKYGVSANDYLESIAGMEIKDYLDYIFNINAFEPLEFKIKTASGKIKKFIMSEDECAEINIEIEDFKVKQCGNKCVFCFCDQHPKTSRKSLVFKDEDYRLSFFDGNYITLSNLTKNDYNRIYSMNLSPLYISLHSTDDSIRRKMLGVNYKFRIMDKIREFAGRGILLNLQIVLVPGYNDVSLESTFQDLMTVIESIESVAVVPVGLTKFRKNLSSLKSVNKKLALETIRLVEFYNLILKKNKMKNIFFASDEIYLIGDQLFPPAKYYNKFPQLENGVGMLAEFKSQFNKYKHSIYFKNTNEKEYIIVTGKLTENFFKEISAELFSCYGLKIDVLAVENKYFGKSVTVTGLLCGNDIIAELKKQNLENKIVLIPDTVLRFKKDIFLDDIEIKKLTDKFENLKIIGSTAYDLITNLYKKFID